MRVFFVRILDLIYVGWFYKQMKYTMLEQRLCLLRCWIHQLQFHEQVKDYLDSV